MRAVDVDVDGLVSVLPSSALPGASLGVGVGAGVAVGTGAGATEGGVLSGVLGGVAGAGDARLPWVLSFDATAGGVAL